MDIKRLARPNVRLLHPYHAGEIPCKIKLDANESPYSAFRVNRPDLSIGKIFTGLNRYPDPEAKSLRNLAARYFGTRPENVLHGNGSDELISCLITTFGGPVLYPTPTFSMYGIISQALGENVAGIPLQENFDIDTESMQKAVRDLKPKLIFLSSPNNPTGNCFSPDRILKILSIVARHSSLVVIDEAYHAFSKKRSFVPMLKKYKNLIVLKTLSKIGLAGLRVGFLLADKEIVNEANKVRLPFNVNALSQTLAVEALKNKKSVQLQIELIISERKRLFREMKKMKGITPYPSDANFILFKTENPDTIYEGLRQRGVLVRNMKGIVDGCLRVTVGTPRENMFFLRSLMQLLLQ